MARAWTSVDAAPSRRCRRYTHTSSERLPSIGGCAETGHLSLSPGPVDRDWRVNEGEQLRVVPVSQTEDHPSANRTQRDVPCVLRSTDADRWASNPVDKVLVQAGLDQRLSVRLQSAHA